MRNDSDSRRILTTHVGSLPRPAPLLAMMQARANGCAVDDHQFAGPRLQSGEDTHQDIEPGLGPEEVLDEAVGGRDLGLA